MLCGYVDQMSDSAGQQGDTPSGPENPRGDAGPDAPAPPGGPQRSDAADGSTETEPQPEAHPSSTPDGAQTIPAPPSGTEPTADGEIHARTQAEQVNEEIQQENAETALDQPSDGSGGE